MFSIKGGKLTEYRVEYVGVRWIPRYLREVEQDL